MKTYILGMMSNPSMSEKKSVSNTKNTCTVCQSAMSDFLELSDLGEDGLLLCRECEARATAEGIYEGIH